MRYDGFYVYNLNPLILGRMGGVPSIPPWVQRLTDSNLKSSFTIVIEHPAWFSGYWLKLLKKKALAFQYRHRGFRYELFRNDPVEEKRCRILGINGAFVSQNVFVDETVFRPHALANKYDAVYVAKAEPFKRHSLACEIKRLHFLMVHPVEPEKIDPRLKHATVNQHDLKKEEIAQVLNQSFCSLALSAEEGGMYAAFESLLCGVPVVSTPSRGGRAVFLDETNSITVKTVTSESIAAAVKSLTERPLNPTFIRNKALHDLQLHRSYMANYLSQLIIGNRHQSAKIHRRLFTRPAELECVGDQIFVSDAAKDVPDSVIEWINRT